MEDLSNPLNTVTGNPDLDPTTQHSFRANFRNFNNSRQSGYSFSGNVGFYGNQVVSYRFIDESAKTITSYRNISGAMNASLMANYNKTLKADAHSFRVNLNFFSNYSTGKGFLNGALFNSRSVSL
ncbi:MAG: TonB-dependent receptor, partial [Sphingobacteriales bacterium]